LWTRVAWLDAGRFKGGPATTEFLRWNDFDDSHACSQVNAVNRIFWALFGVFSKASGKRA